MARLVWHEPHHHSINPALVIGAVWLSLAVIAAIYDVGRWVDAW